MNDRQLPDEDNEIQHVNQQETSTLYQTNHETEQKTVEETVQETNNDIKNDGSVNQSGFLRRRFGFFLSRADSIKWMLRGLMFVPIVMIVDHYYRQQRSTGSLAESLLRVFMIIALIGMMQFPIGLYGVIKHWIRGEDEKGLPKDD